MIKRRNNYISFKKNVVLKENYLINLKNGEVFDCNKNTERIACFIINNQPVKKSFIRQEFGKSANNLLFQLKESGLLKNSKKFAKNSVEENNLSDSHPFYLQWHITKKCNLRCKHCYFDKHIEENELKFLKKDFLKIEQLSNSLGKKLIIAITGGEPLLHPQLFTLLTYLNKRKTIKEVRIASNGTLFTDKLAVLLRQKNVKKCQISLDGIEKTHDEIRETGSFKRVLNGIRIASKNGLKVSAQMVVNKNNLNEAKNVFTLLRNLNVNEIRFSLFVPIGSGKLIKNLALSRNDTKNLFYKLGNLSSKYKNPKILKYRPLWCLINEKNSGTCDFDSGTCLMPNGDLYPCSRLPISIGNIRKKNIFEIWYNSDFMWLHRNPKNLKGKCLNCLYVQKCRGCRAMAYAFYGDSLAEDPTCWLNKKSPVQL